MIQFVNALDLHELYKFVNLFPFLVDRDELLRIIKKEKDAAIEYKLQPRFQINDRLTLSEGEDAAVDEYGNHVMGGATNMVNVRTDSSQHEVSESNVSMMSKS